MSDDSDDADEVYAVITIDSNDIALPPLIAAQLCVPANAWCRSNRCRKLCSRRRHKRTAATADEAEIYYDTPLAVYTDSRYVNQLMQGRTYVHFAYLDFTQRNVSLERLLANLRSRDNVVLLVNEDPGGEHEKARGEPQLELPCSPAYLLRTGNVSRPLLAEVIASIVNAFLLEERLLHADDVADLVCGNRVKTFRPVSSGMRVDIPRMIACRNARHAPDDDSVECR